MDEPHHRILLPLRVLGQRQDGPFALLDGLTQLLHVRRQDQALQQRREDEEGGLAAPLIPPQPCSPPHGPTHHGAGEVVLSQAQVQGAFGVPGGRVRPPGCKGVSAMGGWVGVGWPAHPHHGAEGLGGRGGQHPPGAGAPPSGRSPCSGALLKGLRWAWRKRASRSSYAIATGTLSPSPTPRHQPSAAPKPVPPPPAPALPALRPPRPAVTPARPPAALGPDGSVPPDLHTPRIAPTVPRPALSRAPGTAPRPPPGPPPARPPGGSAPAPLTAAPPAARRPPTLRHRPAPPRPSALAPPLGRRTAPHRARAGPRPADSGGRGVPTPRGCPRSRWRHRRGPAALQTTVSTAGTVPRGSLLRSSLLPETPAP